MSIESILEMIVLPVLAWLLMNSNGVQRRLTRIETLLEDILDNTSSKKRKL